MLEKKGKTFKLEEIEFFTNYCAKNILQFP